ncbi:hypothetical protein A1O3_04302 [Capronia epimyces CBS 606.96]|uniref:Uncharacterized protein n=1 Tax=Capronia epimyces CBS 606.96 TaxID=1182542 RepID=W9Y4D9_9EURO|nr:uncharacterized protein A1O3_04302 [Capronia epimyces CBS 606.96]EXJ87343.1 hypothetical protein A1O3_04302 [Capronia epimyces CBS 606.96]
MPEHAYQPSTGVPSGAAETAASIAFNKDAEQNVSHIPGAYPKEEPSKSTTGSTEAASGATAGLNGHRAGTATHETSGPASEREGGTVGPSTSTTASPAYRDAEDGQAEQPQSAATDPTPADEVPDQPQWSGTLGKILGAVGLGAVAGGAATSHSTTRQDEQSQPGTEAPAQPVTTTGVDSYTAPTRSGPSSSHHRKESIPTTAYPQGESSPTPINAPVGGTSVADEELDVKGHGGRHTGLAAAGVGVGVGSGVVAAGAHDYNKSREPLEDASSPPSAAISTYPQTSQPTPYVPDQQTSGLGRDIDEKPRGTAFTSPSSTVYSEPPTGTESDRKFKGHEKSVAAAGVGIGAGAAAIGAHEYDERKSPSQDAPIQPSATTSAYHQITTNSAAPISSGQQTLPRSRDVDQYPAATTNASQPSSNYSQPPSAAERDSESTGYGKTAAAAGDGAGAGAAGIYAVEHKNKPRTGDNLGDSSYPTTQDSAQARPWEASKDAAATAGQEPASSTRGTNTFQPAAATVPVREKATNSNPNTSSETDGRHTGRDAAIAGAAGTGAAAYGAHEYNKHEADEDAAKTEAQRQKDIAEQEAARQKQFDKDEKAAAKRAVKEEKAEKKHQKGLEKEEKKQQKELEKEEKQHHKELEKEEKQHHKELEHEQKEREKTAGAAVLAEKKHHEQRELEDKENFQAAEAERKRHEKEAAGAAVGVGATAGTVAHTSHGKESLDDDTPKSSHDTDRNRLHKDPPQKKPGILKRIFKRRKNNDTGLEEDYSTDEEEESHRDKHLTESGAIGGAGAVTGTAAEHEAHQPTGSGYEAGQSGGFLKPSYNPLHKDAVAPTATETPTAESLSQGRQEHQPSGTAGVSAHGQHQY